MTTYLREDIAKMREIAKEMEELHKPPPPPRNLEGLALAVMAVVYLIGAYAVAFVLAWIGYLMGGHGAGMWENPHPWHWGSVFLASYWVFFAGVVIAALALAYEWADGVLDRDHASK